jgi:TrmH family RNA methyltransferase
MTVRSSPRRITSRQNPVVARVRDLVRVGSASSAVLEGLSLIREAVRARWPIELIAVTERTADDPDVRALVNDLPAEVDRLITTGPVMAALSPARTASGCLAVVGIKPATLDAAVAASPQLVVCPVNVQDPGNVGAIIRVAEAAGATAVLVCGTSADPFGWKALRGSMGSAFRLAVVPRVPIESALAATSKVGCRLIAAMLSGDAPDQMPLTGPIALFVGAEGQGLPDDVLSACDGRIAVPMTPPVESLNVAVATGIMLYEARRQRNAHAIRTLR